MASILQEGIEYAAKTGSRWANPAPSVVSQIKDEAMGAMLAGGKGTGRLLKRDAAKLGGTPGRFSGAVNLDGVGAMPAPGSYAPSRAKTRPTAPSPSSAPINKVASTNAPIKPQWNAWGAVPLTMMAGGMTANLFSSEENRGLGTFAKGALFGAGGGLGMHMAMGSKIMSRGAASAYKASSGNPTARSFTQGAFQMARMAESQQSRAVAWGAGAMLAGALGSSSKSKAHGINANRGNRFGG